MRYATRLCRRIAMTVASYEALRRGVSTWRGDANSGLAIFWIMPLLPAACSAADELARASSWMSTLN